jgi:hypothetical protein
MKETNMAFFRSKNLCGRCENGSRDTPWKPSLNGCEQSFRSIHARQFGTAPGKSWRADGRQDTFSLYACIPGTGNFLPAPGIRASPGFCQLLCLKKKKNPGQVLFHKRRDRRPSAPMTASGHDPALVGVGVAAGNRVAESWVVCPFVTWALDCQSW